MAMKTPVALSLAAVLAVSGCADVSSLSDPNNPNRNTQAGAVGGALIGAVIGASTGDTRQERTRGAIIGAAIGGGLGGVAGQQLDQQEAELRQDLGSSAQIVNTGSELIVTLPQDILFDTDSSRLTGTLQADLAALARSMLNYPDTTVNVIGHTDNVGSAEYNLDLSQRRATAVSNVLISNGVPPFRIRSGGRGEASPIATNLTPEGRQQNRRVEIIITPNV